MHLNDSNILSPEGVKTHVFVLISLLNVVLSKPFAHTQSHSTHCLIYRDGRREALDLAFQQFKIVYSSICNLYTHDVSKV